MASLLLTFAVKEESRPFQRLIGARPDLKVLLTGIGQRNAEKTVCNALAGQSPRLVLTCGFAGGLNPELATGTVVFSVDEHPTSPINPSPTPAREESQIPDAQFPSPPSRRAIAPLRRDGGWEGLGVGSAEQKFATLPDHLAPIL